MLEPGDQGGARPEGGREAPALGAGRALPGVAPRAGPPTGGPCPAAGRVSFQTRHFQGVAQTVGRDEPPYGLSII